MDVLHKPVLVRVNQGIGTITLARPEAFNVLSVLMLDALAQAFRTLDEDGGVRCVIVTGSEGVFSAGADLKELRDLSAQDALSYSQLGQSVIGILEGLKVPSIAQISGVALGGGCELALATTFRVASATAVLGLPELSLGLIPGFGGTQRLQRLVGHQTARRMILLSERLDAQAALEIGLIDRIASSETLSDVCLAMAEQIARGSRSAFAAATCCLERGGEMQLEEGLRLEAEQFAQVFDTPERVEGLSAFFEKRSPRFD